MVADHAPNHATGPLPFERLYPKEQALLDLVAAERLAGRRVLVYATHAAACAAVQAG